MKKTKTLSGNVYVQLATKRKALPMKGTKANPVYWIGCGELEKDSIKFSVSNPEQLKSSILFRHLRSRSVLVYVENEKEYSFFQARLKTYEYIPDFVSGFFCEIICFRDMKHL